MNSRTAIAIVGALVVCMSIVAGIAAGSGLLATGTTGPDDNDRPNDAIETHSNNMTETEFPWGTVSHSTDSETDETRVEVTAEADGISLSVTTAPDGTDDRQEERTDAETTTFPWGTVAYAADSDTGETAIEVIVDSEDDVSVSATTISEDGSQSTSTTVVSAAGEAGEADANVNVSQSTSVSAGTSISIDGDGDD